MGVSAAEYSESCASCDASEPLQLLQRDSRDLVSKSSSYVSSEASVAAPLISSARAASGSLSPPLAALEVHLDGTSSASLPEGGDSELLQGPAAERTTPSGPAAAVAESFSVFTAKSPRRTTPPEDQTEDLLQEWPLPLTQLVQAQHSAVHTLRGHVFPKEPGGMFLVASLAVVVAFVLAMMKLAETKEVVVDAAEAVAKSQAAAQVNPMLAVRGGDVIMSPSFHGSKPTTTVTKAQTPNDCGS